MTPVTPAHPRPAATVALLRDGAIGESAGLEVWLMRRSPTMAFAAGMQAFPGGAVEAVDHDHALPWAGRSPDSIGAVLGVAPDVARGLVSAAVRETFEECGVLISRGAHGGDEAERLGLLDGSLHWTDLLGGSGRTLDGDALVPWSRWITPEWAPRRFDAYFFLAVMPPAQEPRWIDGEADRAGWTSVRSAIAAHDRGDLPMLPPTIETLRSLEDFGSVRDALAAGPVHIAEGSG